MKVLLGRVLLSDVRLYAPPQGGASRLYAQVTTPDSSFRCVLHEISEADAKGLQLVPVALDADLVITRAGDKGHYIDLHVHSWRDPLPVGSHAGKADNPIKGALDGQK